MVARGQPRFTALTAAAARAAHLIVDEDPPIFADTLATVMLGERADELIGFHLANGTHPVLSCARAQATCRSRYTEDSLAHGLRNGTTRPGPLRLHRARPDELAGRHYVPGPGRHRAGTRGHRQLHAGLIVDYMLPPGVQDAAGNAYAELVGQASADQGETWLSCLRPAEMAALLSRYGFAAIRDVSQREMIPAAAWDRSDSLRPAELSRIAHATVAGRV